MKNRIQTPSRRQFGCFAQLKRCAKPTLLLMLAGLLGGSAHAQLLHRYDFNTVNDTVGTANGTLVGTATLSGGALVTAGGNGAVSGAWSGTGPRMTLDPSAVSGITGAFTLETWAKCTTGWPKYDSYFAFSDGTTANYLMGNPVMGYSPWPSGFNIAGGSGSSSPSVRGIYLDDNSVHQVTITYDGTTFSYYIDGVLANYSGYAATAPDTGFNLSTLTDVGINGGSPWGDPCLTGSTYDFRIYGQSLTAAQVASVYALGSDASNVAISAAIAPPTAFVWDGAGADNNWSTALNWIGGIAPAVSGTSLTFDGSTRTSPNLNTNYSVNGLMFSNTASSFTLGTTTNTLTLAGDVVNNSANVQTFNVPLALSFPLALNAAAGSLVVNSNISLGSSALTLSGNNNFTLNGTVSGTGNFTKTGKGTLTYAPSALSVGTVSFNDGTSILGGSVTSAGSGISYIGYTTGDALVSMSGNTWNFSGELRVGGSDVNGSTIVGFGIFSVSAGTVTASALSLARGNYLDNAVSGTLNLNNGSTFISTNDVIVQFAGSGHGKLVVNNSTFIIGPGATKWFNVGYYDSGAGELDLTNGTLALENGSSIKMSHSGNTGGNVINQVGTSTVTFYGDAGVTVGGSGNLDLNYAGGGSSSSTYNLMGGTLTVPQIVASSSSGSGTFDFNGGTLKPTASTAAFMQGLSAANVMVGGAKIDTTGFNITIGQGLSDGDGLGGGLLKLGNGTLTLAGGYTFSGPIVVQGGALSLDGAQSSSGSALTVSNASLSLSANNGSSSLSAGAVAFIGTTALNVNFGTATSPSSTAITASSLSVTGTNTINISGAYLVVGQYPLIHTGSAVSTSNFKLGTLPTGMAATLVNSGSSLDLLVTAAGQNLTWYGADSSGNPLTTWNINSSANWNTGGAKYLQYSGNSYGDNVTFDDTLYAASDANITLNTTVVPANVVFNNSSTPYSITGTGGISGAASVTMAGTGSTYLGTTNSYTGGTTVDAGTLSVISDQALGATTSAVSLSGGILQFSNSTTSARSLTVVSNSTIDLPANASVQLGGAITGSGSLTKTGLGSLTIAGADIGLSNYVSAGVLNLSGGMTNTAMTVGNAAGNVIMNISGSLVTSNLFVGNVSGAVAAAYQTGGFVSANGGTGDNLSVGNWDGSFGYFCAAGGSMSVNGINIGGEENPNVWPPAGGGDGIMDVYGATINNIGWIVLARGAGPNTGILNVFSGSVTYSGGGLGCNWNGSASAVGGTQTSIVNVLGGTVTSTNQGVNFRTDGNVGIVNLNGGLLSGTSVTGFGTLNFNGGTLQPCVNFANPFLNLTYNAYVYSGGAKIDDNGQALTLTEPLLAPAGSGVTGPVTISNHGAGYIAPPIVTISGDGSNATAIAQIDRNAGTVTNVIITSPGMNYTTATFTFSEGGATTQASASAGTAVNVSGGLTKLGAGTVTLDGTNTYAGATTVSAGTLAGTGIIAGALINNATLAPGDSGSGALTVNGNLTLAAGSTNAFAVNGSTPANAAVIAGGSVHYGGVLKIVPTGTFTLGQTFPLFTGAGATSASNFSSVQGSAGSGLGFAFTNGVLTVVAVATINPNPPQMQVSMTGSGLRLAWPTNAGWILQSNSVGLTATSSWFKYPANGSVDVTNVNITLDPSKSNVFFRMVKP